MEGAGATEADEGEVARVVALFDRDKAERAAHVFVHDGDDAFGRILERFAEASAIFCTALTARSRRIVMSPPSLASEGR